MEGSAAPRGRGMTVSIRVQLRALEALRPGRALALSASRLEIDLLPPLYEALRTLGPVERLAVVVQCRGGEVNAARRIALLLHAFARRLTFLVPYRCESAGTVLALAAHEIVAGPMAVFSPIGPHFPAEDGDAGPSAMSSEDFRPCWRRLRDGFGPERPEAREKSLQRLCDNVFPTTLTALHRSTRELERIGGELLSLAHGARPREAHAEIVSTLLYGFDAPACALTANDLRRIGLPVVRDTALEAAARDAGCELRRLAEPESRRDEDDHWHDAVIATAEAAQRRLRRRDAPAGRWEPVP